ncbi:tat pathway signal sequence domain-containing protein [Penicillium odoratum]|uniref:tat pathway signal sequence domain-containing protein n=1 Tax=Penicillium odoratum TaxID=1167516 RepID=UPI002548243F|nr:tat pathway signal sequence domain-containing protein [Penicillium odoratum]KAJ5776924.1 tat pathway signal sequence domain-containing protein [Penicillium odoratum]
MRFCAAITVAAIAAVSSAASCPYAERAAAAAAAPGCPYVKRAAEAAAQDAHGLKLSKRGAIKGKKGIFYMNRIGPSGSQLWIANADGTNKTQLMGNQTNAFDYHPSWSQDGEWIVFTSERRGAGQSDLYRVRPDGTGLEILADTNSVEDAGVLSPDGSQVAYVSTQGNYTTNIWVKDLKTGLAHNLTDTAATRSSKIWPSGHFRPSWSPDGEWIAFSSDRDTDWTGHSNGTGWEHTQNLGLYVVKKDGRGFRKLAFQDGYALGTPQFSGDGKRVIYNNITRENTYYAHGVSAQQEFIESQIYSVDFATGKTIVAHTSGSYPKFGQHYIGNSSNIGYFIKAGSYEGIHYTKPDSTHKTFNLTNLRDPWWSPDGSKVVYSIPNWTQQAADLELFSYDNDWAYRYMDVFPTHNTVVNRIASTQKVLGSANGSLVTSDTLYNDVTTALNSYSIYSNSNTTEVEYLTEGEAGAFQPTWNPDGTELLVGFGGWFADRTILPAAIIHAYANGTSFSTLTHNTSINSGFPSWSPDGSAYVYREWNMDTGAPEGLKIHNFTTGETHSLTKGWDNTPGWSPDGERIVFTRNNNWTISYGSRWYEDRFDIYTIRPDGSELTRVTDSLSNDAHAVWSHDGRIMWSTGMYGFKDESSLFDNTFQPYGQIMVMNYDGTNKTLLTDTIWEDSMPLYIPNEYLE